MTMLINLKPSATIWMTAFRPFFLLGTMYAFLAMVAWLSILFGWMPSPFKGSAIDWHGYEMVFGFLRAILIGFLFTAGQSWTGKTLLKGTSLLSITLLWILGRFAFLNQQILAAFSFGLDITLDLIILYLLVIAFHAKGQERNRIISYGYFLFFLCHLLAGFASFHVIPMESTLHYVHLAIFILVLFVMIIAGRILPFFTSAAIREASPANHRLVERLIHPLFFIFLAFELIVYWLEMARFGSAILALLLGYLNVYRLSKWESLKAIRIPILFILHISYFWLALGFIFFALFRLNVIPASSAYHLFTVGGLSTFIYGMVTRVSLGHTARQIIASKWTHFAYYLLNAAVIIRVGLPLFSIYKESYLIAGIFWIIAFGLFVCQYIKILISPRLDGKLG
ncbi:NnrS family protein [Leptospira ognonensis]|uniref:NnrS family protein n=2 Tax=Leptospira ognonensis TaxID=2484945 RepID=A0A4R9K8I9_9LEPT|nr:NnrS family protein [Leptospira ognonensis]